MSSAAPNPTRSPRVAPRIAQRALQRARLTVVPRPRIAASRAPRVPFVMLISALLLGGVIGLLFFNTSMQQASFRETALSRQARDLDAQQEALQLQLDALRDPQRIARLAQRMGMIVPAGTSGILDFRTGRISGTPVPAEGPGLPLRQASATPPAGFAPAKAGTTKAGTAGTAAKSGRTSTRHGAPTKNR